MEYVGNVDFKKWLHKFGKMRTKKNEVPVRIGTLCNAVNFIKHFAD